MSLQEEIRTIVINKTRTFHADYGSGASFAHDMEDTIINKVLDAANERILQFGLTQDQHQFCLMIMRELDKLRGGK